ncbi:MAG: calcium-binding protein [Gallionella sp.]|nr:calcium-binding protein [Gallionella sp.]
MATQFEIDCALMAGRAYQDTRNSTTWLPVPQGWSELEHLVKDSGFEAGYFKRSTGTNTEIVISFAGTGGDGDWGTNLSLYLGRVPAQLKEAADYYLSVKAANPDATITFTGHSLGGGLASLMAAFFGEQATTFDQAPFASTATTANAQIIKDYLLGLGKGYGTDPNVASALTRLDAFINGTDSLATRTTGISNIFVQGEALQSFSDKLGTPQEIQQTSLLNNQPFGLTSTDLHSQALLTAFLQSESFRAATEKLPDLLPLIFDSKLYKTDVGTGKVNFIEKLVQSEAAIPSGSLLDRFSADMTTLGAKQNWPSIVTDINTGNLGRALMAFALQKHYEETSTSAGAGKEFFTDMVGGVQFDIASVSDAFNTAFQNGDKLNLTDAKGYVQYFKSYLNTLPDGDRVIVEQLLPHMRDWYVQAGASGMNATDTLNRGAFMLGGVGADALVGGTGSDLLIGNAGDDLLQGGGGNDTMLGGSGNDAYVYTTGDGLDTILDTGGQNTLAVDGNVLAGGDQYGDTRVHRDTSGHLYVQADPKTLLIDGNIVIQNYGTGGTFGLTMNGAFADVNPITTNPPIVGDFGPMDFYDANGNVVYHYDDLNNLVTDPNKAGDRADTLNGSAANDHISSGAGNDTISATQGGNDLIEAGSGRDIVYAGGGNDVIIGGTEGDILYGSSGDDRLYADIQIDTATAIANGNTHADLNTQGDWLNGGAGSDTLVGSDAQDVLMGGGGSDLLIGGAGNDDILGDANYIAQSLNWTVTDTNGTRLFQPVTGETTAADGAADVIYAGEGNDYVWAGAGNDVVFGEGGNDQLSGNEGNDILSGGTGSDILSGGTGSDTFLYNQGDGEDWINDTANPTDLNVIHFGQGISASQIKLTGYLKLDLGSGDIIHINNFSAINKATDCSIQRFEFADGTALTAAELLKRGFDLTAQAGETAIGSDYGDRLSGGNGSTLAGMGGNDTYQYSRGNGEIHIADNLDGGQTNTLRFAAGISASDITLSLGSLKLDLGNGDTIHIDGILQDDVANTSSIQRFEFADGTTLTLTDLLAKGFDLNGAAGDNKMRRRTRAATINSYTAANDEAIHAWRVAA